MKLTIFLGILLLIQTINSENNLTKYEINEEVTTKESRVIPSGNGRPEKLEEESKTIDKYEKFIIPENVDADFMQQNNVNANPLENSMKTGAFSSIKEDALINNGSEIITKTTQSVDYSLYETQKATSSSQRSDKRAEIHPISSINNSTDPLTITSYADISIRKINENDLENSERLSKNSEVAAPEVSSTSLLRISEEQGDAKSTSRNLIDVTATVDTYKETALADLYRIDAGNEKAKCELPPEIVDCEENGERIVLWYFDPIDKQCLSTSDCISSKNSFATKADCNLTCLPKSPIKRCLDPPVAGHIACSAGGFRRSLTATIHLAYYDKVEEKCSWSMYLGCGGTSNQFKSIEQCRDTCTTAEAILSIRDNAQDLCRLPRLRSLSSTCNGSNTFSVRWYYDTQSKRCREFGYFHCSGTANNFLKKSDCEKFCGARALTPDEICQLPVDTGECNSSSIMWFHNGTGCHSFVYKGCSGNENRFFSETDCLSSCRPEDVTDFYIDDAWSISIEENSIKDTKRNSNLNEDFAINYTQDIENTAPTTPPQVQLPLPDWNVLETHPPLIYNLDDFRPKHIDIEPCRSERSLGNCRPSECWNQTGSDCAPKHLLRWYFNPHTSDCESFLYSGCGGTANVYDSAQSCIRACKQRIMKPDRDKRCDNDPKTTDCYSLPLLSHIGNDSAHKLLFFFSVASGTCRAFHLNSEKTTCSENSYFTDGKVCLDSCRKSSPTEVDLSDRCYGRKLAGTSSCSRDEQNISRWSYLSELGQCILFSDCHTSNETIWSSWGNNFQTKQLCESTCLANSLHRVCTLPKDPGPCNESHPRYYYDFAAKDCKIFLYSGCLGNKNRFITESECEDACGYLKLAYNPDKSTSAVEVEKIQPNDESPAVPAGVFDKMRRITNTYSEKYPWDFCLQPHVYGTCPNLYYLSPNSGRHVRMTRFFYSRRSGKCEPFIYTGCGSRGNHFETMDDCNRICTNRLQRSVSKACRSLEIKECPDSGITGWKFEPSLGTCLKVELCADSVTSNRFQRNFMFGLHSFVALNIHAPGIFASSLSCYDNCRSTPPNGTDVQNICHMSPITSVSSYCGAMVERWFFDSKSGQCRSYVTCPAYGNNFPDLETCLSTCRPTNILDVCRQPLDHGGCSNFQARWYYNSETRSCKPFQYGGCFGNSNRFLSRIECDTSCTNNDICRLPKPALTLSTNNPDVRYFFNQSSHECELFLFNGKIPHGNNFATEETCQRTCLSFPKLYPLSIKVKKWALAPEQMGVKLQNLGDEPADSFRLHLQNKTIQRRSCYSSPDLANLINRETSTRCHPNDITNELAFEYNADSNACIPIEISICLEFPGEVYEFKILDQPLIFESQSVCESLCKKNQ